MHRVERLVRVLTSPREVFDEIRERPSILLPLICILIAGGVWAAVQAYNVDEAIYALEAKAQNELGQVFSTILGGDVEQLEEKAQDLDEIEELTRRVAEGETIDVDSLGVSSEDIARVRTNATAMAPFMSAVGIALVLLLLGTYYFIAARVVKVEVGWEKWFAFACWAGLPYVVGYIVKIVLVFFGGAKLGNALAPMTWFGFEGAWAMFLDGPLFWSFFIAIQGFMCWTSKDVRTSAVVVVLPAALAVGLLCVLEGFSEFAVQSLR